MISAIVLTHNSQELLDRTLTSLSWCDEIIIVDDDSTDGTEAIAKTFGVVMYRRSLKGDFAKQRNFGLAKATGDWVLFVDSDEVVGPQLAKEIREVTRNSKLKTPNDHAQGRQSSKVGYYLARNDWFLGRWLKHGETANVRLLRLARLGSGEWMRPVHEVWHIQGEVGQLQSPLLHYPHPTVAQFLEEVNYYSTFNADHLYRRGTTVRWWEIAGYPLAKFVLNYIFRLGILDGMPGAVTALMMSFHSFLTRAKLWQLWDKKLHPGYRAP